MVNRFLCLTLFVDSERMCARLGTGFRAGGAHTDLAYGLANTVILLVSSALAAIASQAARWPSLGRFSLPTWLANTSMLTLLASLAIFFALLFVPLLEKPEQQNCLAMLVFVSILWATEVRIQIHGYDVS